VLLCVQVYINTLRQSEAQLAALLPAGQRQGPSIGEGRGAAGEGDEGDDSEDEQQQGDDDGEEAAAAWEQGAIKVGVCCLLGPTWEGTSCSSKQELATGFGTLDVHMVFLPECCLAHAHVIGCCWDDMVVQPRKYE